MYMSAFGKNILVINSIEAAHDLLEKQSSIYSDRERMVMVLDLYA